MDDKKIQNNATYNINFYKSNQTHTFFSVNDGGTFYKFYNIERKKYKERTPIWKTKPRITNSKRQNNQLTIENKYACPPTYKKIKSKPNKTKNFRPEITAPSPTIPNN